MFDVFGRNIGSTHVEELVDSCSRDFQEKLIEKCCHFSLPSTANINGFICWFQTKCVVIEETMLSIIREEYGLGCQAVPFTTNACEAANAMLKSHTNYKE